MRASYMSINRVDAQQAVQEVTRSMAEPNEGAWSMLKRLVRYLLGSRHSRAGDLRADRDYAGCILTMKSTTCAHLFHGVNSVKAESEFYAGVKGGSIVLGAQSMMIDFGENVAQCVLGTDSGSETWSRTDSTSALSYAVVARTCGLWRNAHRETKGRAQHGRHCTKAVTAPVLRKHLKTLKMEWRDGRHPPALSAAP